MHGFYTRDLAPHVDLGTTGVCAKVGNVFHAENVRLRHQIGSLAAGTCLRELSVKLDTFEVLAVCAITGNVEQTLCILCARDLGLFADTIVREVCDLLHRGHVLGLPGCTCLPTDSGWRAAQLGLDPRVRGPCLCLGARRHSFGHREVEQQLMVTSLEHAMVGTQTMVEVLARSGVFVMKPGEVELAKDHCVHDEATLLAHVRKYPMGINETSPSLQYSTAHRDVQSLQGKNLLIVLKGALGCRRFFAVSVSQQRVSEAVRKIWFAH